MGQAYLRAPIMDIICQWVNGILSFNLLGTEELYFMPVSQIIG
jgi:hypothetical protein